MHSRFVRKMETMKTKLQYIIRGTYRGVTEDVDEFDTRAEAEKMLFEYMSAYGKGWRIEIVTRVKKEET